MQEIERLDRELSGFKYELLEISANDKRRSRASYDKELKYKMVCDIVNNLENADYDEINGLLKELFIECVYDGQTLHIKI